MEEISSIIVHASAISFSGKGILILGASGSGKSKLALALISCGAILIADDQVILNNNKNEIVLSAPKAILGKIEARNIGILEVSSTKAQLCLVVSLDKTEHNRLPKTKYTEYFGKKIQTLHCKDLNGLEHSLIHFLKKIIM